MSLAVERRAPAPASVGTSQVPTGAPPASCPGARRARIGADSVIAVSFMPRGSRIRFVTSSS